jgi:hypothetical protein
MRNITQVSYSVKNLRELFAQKIFAVPELQREFVWNAQKACALLDSIYQNLPIGTALIWKAGRRYETQLRKQLHILPPYDARNKHIWYIVDGQQRLSVLHQIFEGKQVENSSGRVIDFSKIYLSLDPQPETRFEYLLRLDPSIHFSVNEILSHNWQQRFRALPQYKLHAIQLCRQRILNYKFPMIFAETNNLAEVRESFIRINSRGTSVSAADRAFARATKFELRYLVRELLSGLKRGFDSLPREVVLLVIALQSGEKDVGDRAIQAVVKKIEQDEAAQSKFHANWPKIKVAIEKAVDYLERPFGVISYGFLPYTNMVTTLALFFYYNNLAQPTSMQKRELSKWFWATAVCQRYAGRGFRQNILSDAEFFEKLGQRRNAKFHLEDHERIPVTDLLRTDYSKRSGLVEALYCLLSLQEPLFFKSGGSIPHVQYSAAANRKDKHHIFPKDLLRRHGFAPRDWNSICNICFVAAEENQTFGNKLPVIYLQDYRKYRYFSKVMKSHLIPRSANSGLWTVHVKRDYKIFLKERMVLIAHAFEGQAGIKLFRKD